MSGTPAAIHGARHGDAGESPRKCHADSLSAIHSVQHRCPLAELLLPALRQVVQVCAEHKKLRKLLKHLETVREAGRGARNPPRVLVFANRVKTVRFLAATLAGAGFKTAMLHGERSQPEREVRLVCCPAFPFGLACGHGSF